MLGSRRGAGSELVGSADKSSSANRYRSLSGASGRNSATAMNKDLVGADSGVGTDTRVAIEATGLAGALASCVAVGSGADWAVIIDLDAVGPDCVGNAVGINSGIAGDVAPVLAHARTEKASKAPII